MSNFKTVRIRDKAHLIWLRDLPCAFCRLPPPSEASHIRLLSNSGVAIKPADNRALPSCHACHMTAHRIGERTFYGNDLDAAIRLAEDLYENTGDTEKASWLMLGWRHVK